MKMMDGHYFLEQTIQPVPFFILQKTEHHGLQKSFLQNNINLPMEK